MAAAPASIAITVRLPENLVTRLDALAAATQRTRSYWVQKAVADAVKRELRQIRDIEEAIDDDDANPDEGMAADAFEIWMIEEGLTTRQALDAAAVKARRGHTQNWLTRRSP